jgi:catechol 2,3-dioxygenase
MDPNTPYGIPPSGYRLPPETRLGRILLQVGDLSQSLAFYCELLGFKVLDEDGAQASLGASEDAETLIVLQERAGAVAVPRGRRLGLFHFAILLPDRASLGRFLAHVTQRGIRPGASDHRVSEALYLHDPDGLGIEVYADRPPASWEQQDGQLVMATDPLDQDDLLRAGRTGNWQGMPPGTVMGHMHLHVGDLGRAADFYHEGLGLDKVVWSYPGALFMSAGGYHHHLGVNTWAPGATSPGEDEARLLEWELVLPGEDDVEAALAHLGRAGHLAEQMKEGGVVKDPWGTQLRIRQG